MNRRNLFHFRHVLLVVILTAVATVLISPTRTVNADVKSRWGDTRVVTDKYLFIRDLVRHSGNESARIRATGACRTMGHEGGFAVYGYYVGKCTLAATITKNATGRVVFRGTRTVNVQSSKRSTQLPRQSPIKLDVPGLTMPTKRSSINSPTKRFTCTDIIIRFAGRTHRVANEFQCYYKSARSSEIFNMDYYDHYVGRIRHRDFYPSLVRGLSEEQVCQNVADSILRSGAVPISISCSRPLNAIEEGTHLCATVGKTTVIYHIRAASSKDPVVLILTLWQTSKARQTNTQELSKMLAPWGDPIEDPDNYWSPCRELFGRSPYVLPERSTDDLPEPS